MVIETQYLTKVLHIYIFLQNSTILNLALVNGRCPSGGPLFRSIGWSCGMNWKWCIQQERNKLLGPREGVTPPPMPRVKTGVREEVCHSSATPPFLSLSSHSYHTVGSFLSLRGASSSLSRALWRLFLHRLQDTMTMRKKTTAVMPPPIANASRRRSEKEARGERATWEDRNSSDAWGKILYFTIHVAKRWAI